MPITLFVSYTLFSLFGFYQKLHIKNFKGGSQGFLFILNLFVLVATLYGLGFLLYYGYSVSWIQAALLFVVSLAIQFVWFPIEAKLGIKDLHIFMSLGGFVVLPICAVFMWLSFP